MISPEQLATNPPEYDVNTYNPYQGCEDETELFYFAFWLRKDIGSKS